MNIIKIIIFLLFIACLILLIFDFNNSPKVRDGIAELFVGGIIAEIILEHFKN